MPPSPRAASLIEGAGRVLGLDDARGVELHELGVAQPAARLDGEAERVAGVLVAARRGAPPDAVVPAGGEDDRVGVDEVAGAVVEVEAVGAEDRAVVVHQEARDVHRVEDRHVQLRGAVDQRALDLEPGVVAGEGGAAVGVRAEEALRDAAVVLAGERHAVALEVVDAAGRARGDDLDRVRVGEQVALLERVGGVLLPAVVGVHGGEGGVDAAGGERGVRVGLGRLPRASTSTPASASSMAARRPDPPVPMTRTVVEIWRSEVVLPEVVVELMPSTLGNAHPITPMHHIDVMTMRCRLWT